MDSTLYQQQAKRNASFYVGNRIESGRRRKATRQHRCRSQIDTYTYQLISTSELSSSSSTSSSSESEKPVETDAVGVTALTPWLPK